MRLGIEDRVVAKAEHMLNQRALGQSGNVRLGHATDRPAFHRRSELERRNVRFHVVHAATHVRIDRHDDVLNQNLAFGWLGKIEFHRFERGTGRHSGWAFG